MRGYGEHVQYSVFICQLTETQYMTLKVKLDGVINHKHDQVMFVYLGPVTKEQLEKRISTIGREYLPIDLAKLIY